MTKPFFSIIIPTYNRCKFLNTAIESVLEQTFRNFELIVIDDGSTDQTEQLIKDIKDKRLKYIKKNHRGVSAARNIGIQQSCGQFICFLDSDDRFKDTKLEIAYKYILDFPKYMIFHTEELWYRYGKVLNQKKIHKKPQGDVFINSLRLCCIGMSTTVVKINLFDQIGNFDENFQACEDYEFWLRVSALYPVKLIPEALTIKQGGHPDQLSKKFPAMDTLRIRAIEKLLKLEILNKQQRQQTIQELKRKCAIYINGAKKRKKLKEVEHYETLLKQYAQ
ncbi:MAG: glycosyltransferase [Candidatus Omnitrophica bacterium]|nr:glycosyltransferase [Candidatus Omnitrophota bacterium]